MQCGVPASCESGVEGRHSYHRYGSEFKSHLTGPITPGKPSKVETGRPRQPHKLLQPPAEGTWQWINLLHSHIQPTRSCLLYPAIIQVAHFLLTISAFFFFLSFLFLLSCSRLKCAVLPEIQSGIKAEAFSAMCTSELHKDREMREQN